MLGKGKELRGKCFGHAPVFVNWHVVGETQCDISRYKQITFQGLWSDSHQIIMHILQCSSVRLNPTSGVESFKSKEEFVFSQDNIQGCFTRH